MIQEYFKVFVFRDDEDIYQELPYILSLGLDNVAIKWGDRMHPLSGDDTVETIMDAFNNTGRSISPIDAVARELLPSILISAAIDRSSSRYPDTEDNIEGHLKAAYQYADLLINGKE